MKMMKKTALPVLILLILSLAVRSNQGAAPDGADPPQPGAAAMLDAGVWPANEYTEGLPEPSGTVSWAMLDSQHKNCSISMTGMSETDYGSYLDRLKQDGFSVVEEVSEEIKGQDYVSVGTLLSNGERWLSISYLPDRLTLFISFEESGKASSLA